MSAPRDLTKVPCPDCGGPLFGRSDDGQASCGHADTCPLGRALDETSAADRAWFEAHPAATEYRRPPSYDERTSLLAMMTGGTVMPDGHRWRGRVLVTRLAPGVRARHYDDMVLACPPGCAGVTVIHTG